MWAVNQRGYGGTSRPPGRTDYGLDQLTGDVAGLIDAAGAESVTLIAHDWGAFVAWTFAIRRIRPLARLVIVNVAHPLCFRRELKTWAQRRKSWYAGFFQMPVLPELLLTARGGRLLAATMRHDACNPQAFPDAVLAVYRANVTSPGAATAMLNWYRAAGRDVMAATDLDAMIETPTLVIWGEEDVALGLPCLNGTDRYVRDLRIERLPGVLALGTRGRGARGEQLARGVSWKGWLTPRVLLAATRCVAFLRQRIQRNLQRNSCVGRYRDKELWTRNSLIEFTKLPSCRSSGRAYLTSSRKWLRRGEASFSSRIPKSSVGRPQ